MSGRFLLDSNALIALIAGDPRLLDTISEAETYLCLTALGELYYGATKSVRVAENMARVDQLAAAFTVMLPDVQTARQYGQIRGLLQRAGTPIPENDIWIAALAKQHGLGVLTRDAHFGQVGGLVTQDW